MWNNYTMVAELLGSFVLVFGVLATIKASSAKTFSLQGTAKHIFVALGIALSLMLAVYVAEVHVFGDNGRGYVNPAVALMQAIQLNEWKYFGPAIAGEFIGGVAAVLVSFVGCKLMKSEKSIIQVATINVRDSFLGEIPGAIIFLGGVALATTGVVPGQWTGFIVGLSIFASISLIGWRYALLLNPMVGAVLLLNDAFNKGFQKANLSNYLVSAVANLSVAAAIGAVYYGLSQM